MAYADGVVGGNAESADTPGPLFAYQDGSLGATALAVPASIQAAVRARKAKTLIEQYMQRCIAAHAPSATRAQKCGTMAYMWARQNGLLAQSRLPRSFFGLTGLGQDGPLMAYADGVVGGQAADADMPGPIVAYHDGSLGDAGDDDATPVDAFHDGVLGPHYDGMDTFGPLMAYHDGSLGATQVSLDLGDQSALTEVKSMMALLAPEQTLTADGQKVYTPDWYTSGIWDPQASLLWQYIVSKTAAFSGKDVSVTAGDQTYPNATAIGFMVSTIGAPTASSYGPDYLKKNFPILSAWFSAGGGPVLAPYLSLADKTREERAGAGGGTKMSTMAMYGLGAVALLGLALVFRRK
jgi:hypothetical protein